ncbi:hypothetical protein IH779_01790 [Patescibacteria group bacterium]|nr:hypothetical protein [Patescibacteria group bacterium]
MTETDLIKKIRLLKQIRPSKDWVLLTKRELFKEETPVFKAYRNPASVILRIFPRLFLNYRFAVATFVVLGILASGAVNLAQNSLPGDFLYPVKRISEKGRAVFVSEKEKPKAQLELANKRLDELTKIAEENQVRKLAPAISEFQASLYQAAKDLKKPSKLTQEIVDQTQRLKEKREKIKVSYGINIGESEEYKNTLREIVQRNIEVLEESSLTENQETLLVEAKEDFDAENFTGALVKILLLSQSK